jgi:hypothetical protein
VGSRVIAGWAAGDAPMRNLAAVMICPAFFGPRDFG